MDPYYSDSHVTLYHGDALDILQALPDSSVDCCVTSPPYFGLRDYGVDGQHGLEASPAEYVERIRGVFAEVRRVLAADGTLWVNIGDSYSAKRSYQVDQSKGQRSRIDQPYDTTGFLAAKNLLGIPWRLAFALQDDGWILRNDIIWAKPNGMPESVTDRLATKHEHLFMLAKSHRYHFDLDAIREPLAHPEAADGTRVFGGRNKASSLTVGSSARRTGGAYGTPGRAQKRRAAELFESAGLTSEHLAAMRAVGMSDAGKAVTTQSGAGKNAPDVQRLAAEAKAAEGGYYREFLYDGGRNPGDVWTIPTVPFPGAHFACMPPELARRAILAGCKPGGTVLDPFSGSGTTGMAAVETLRKYVGIDLNSEYLDLSLRTRFRQGALPIIVGAS